MSGRFPSARRKADQSKRRAESIIGCFGFFAPVSLAAQSFSLRSGQRVQPFLDRGEAGFIHDDLVGVPARGIWREIINTDAREYGGSGWGNLGGVESSPVSAHGRTESVNLSLPPLSTIILRWEARG